MISYQFTMLEKLRQNLLVNPFRQATEFPIHHALLIRGYCLSKSMRFTSVLVLLALFTSVSYGYSQIQSPISYEKTGDPPIWNGNEFIKDQVLSLIHADGHIEVYSDERLSGQVAWPLEQITSIWKYATQVYLKSSTDEKLIIVAHNKKNKGCYLTLTAADVRLNRIVMDLNFRDWKQDVVSHICMGLGVMLTDKDYKIKAAHTPYRSKSIYRFIGYDLMNSLENSPRPGL